MIPSRASALQTVYRGDQVPDGLLMRFCKKMQFGEMTGLIVLQIFRLSLRNMHPLWACVCSDALSKPTLASHWLPGPTDDVVCTCGHSCGFDSVYMIFMQMDYSHGSF